MNEGPWSFNNSLIILEELVGVGELNKMKFDHISFWIQFHNLPLICMKKELGWELGSQVGSVEDIDTGATGDCLGTYMRVKV